MPILEIDGELKAALAGAPDHRLARAEWRLARTISSVKSLGASASATRWRAP